MSDDKWTDADDARLTLHALPDDHPVKLTMAIWDALREHPRYVDLLAVWVTPESRERWGDFSEIAGALYGESLNVMGTVRQFEDALDVAYVWVIRAKPGAGPRMTNGPEAVNLFAVFTWVWRPELGGWRLHSAGEQRLPDRLPRTSPNEAPLLDYLPA